RSNLKRDQPEEVPAAMGIISDQAQGQALATRRLRSALQGPSATWTFHKGVRLFREVGLTLAPTFVPFTPWISLEGYQDLLATLAEMDLIEHVAPIQLAIRLLIPAGSRLLELREVRDLALGFDDALLSYRWQHPDQRVDRLQAGLQELVRQEETAGAGRREIFGKVWLLAEQAAGKPRRRPVEKPRGPARTPIPFMTEPWFC
ncbi:MAG: CUAEP/CCAEP-tail radical SAM protein, partial [candidate division NC10 bacterium]